MLIKVLLQRARKKGENPSRSGLRAARLRAGGSGMWARVALFRASVSTYAMSSASEASSSSEQ